MKKIKYISTKKETCVCCLKEKNVLDFKWILFKLKEKNTTEYYPYHFCNDDCLTEWAKRKQW